ncbi:rod shape-determining protein MreC [Rubrivirga sp. SAORIC476]|uniref:rod shape-determining protein MreC n=1 Tax=Rubrivirga sp. SAORIC476 TaxID=1961794 RepID=UPI000BA999CF|nr:rod shape-determining protein MreC [Rubrivirga sp. SAORIC476]PAP74461.1 rod shape-determining protein MreC [Rubrivirga sp. SAORIC476]
MALAQQIWERTRDYVVFGTLLLIGVVIFVGRNGPALRAARAASLAVTAPVEGVFERAARFRQSLEENERLRMETADLSADVARLREAAAENAQLRALLQFEDTTTIRRVVGRVVAKDITEQSNLLTIDVGERDSVEIGMPVINERGIVGRVILTNDRYAVVMPHQNTQFRVPASIEELGREGVVRWDGASFDKLTMEYVVKTEPVERGMLVVTSPFSGVFPAGISVGRVDTAYAAAGRNDYVIQLEPAAPISEVGYVYVLLTRPDPEQAILEAQARDSLGIERATSALDAQLEAATEE